MVFNMKEATELIDIAKTGPNFIILKELYKGTKTKKELKKLLDIGYIKLNNILLYLKRIKLIQMKYKNDNVPIKYDLSMQGYLIIADIID